MAVSAISALAGTPAGAERIVKEQRLAQLEWKQQLLQATTPEQKQTVYHNQPNYGMYGKKMTNELTGSLDRAWSMPYIIWTMREFSELSAAGTKHLIKAVEKSHQTSPLMGEFCIALVSAGESNSQASTAARLAQEKTRFIKSVLSGSATKEVKGQAALALSGVMARRGDDRAVNGERLKLIRQAIIDAADVKVGDTTVADLAREEIYRMSNLSKGSKAPELVGYDSGGQPMKLSDTRGKIAILIFWSSWEQAESVINFSKKMEKTYAGKPVEVIGVNRDSLTNLRKLVVADKSVGKSFTDPNGKLFAQYRVATAPVCFVLDKDGRIQYNGAPGSFVDFTVSALLAPKK